MKTCNKCKIEINTIREYCPLCHQLLEGENDPNHVEMFLEKDGPRIPVSPKAQRIIAFIFMFAMAVLGVINIVDVERNGLVATVSGDIRCHHIEAVAGLCLIVRICRQGDIRRATDDQQQRHRDGNRARGTGDVG